MKPCFLDTCAVIDLMARQQTVVEAIADFATASAERVAASASLERRA
jgi:hypothetical protein